MKRFENAYKTRVRRWLMQASEHSARSIPKLDISIVDCMARPDRPSMVTCVVCMLYIYAVGYQSLRSRARTLSGFLAEALLYELFD